MGLSNTIALVVFTQFFPEYGILTLIAGAALSLGVLYFYGKHAKRASLLSSSAGERIMEGGTASEPPLHTAAMQARAYAPLLLGVALVLLTKVPGVRGAVESLRFTVRLWGYEPISVNVFTSAGFFVLVTALVCYLFSLEQANVAKDFSIASRRSVRSLSTLAVGSALVYLLVDTGQIQLLARVLLSGGKATYAWLSPTMEAVGGIAFGQGLPADFLLAAMQVSVAPALGIPLAVLVGIVTVMSEGPPNPLKPTQIAYTQSLANVEGKDGEIFRACLKWQILGLAAATIAAVALVYLSR
jgi:lactate permease